MRTCCSPTAPIPTGSPKRPPAPSSNATPSAGSCSRWPTSASGAVSGNTTVGNRGGLLGRWQHIDYVSGFNLDRRMHEVLQCTPTVPGAIGAFRRDVLAEVGGVSGDTLAEDTDLTPAIGRTGRRMVYAVGIRAHWKTIPRTGDAEIIPS